MLWVCFTSEKTGEFFRTKRNGMELNTGKIPEDCTKIDCITFHFRMYTSLGFIELTTYSYSMIVFSWQL